MFDLCQIRGRVNRLVNSMQVRHSVGFQVIQNPREHWHTCLLRLLKIMQDRCQARDSKVSPMQTMDCRLFWFFSHNDWVSSPTSQIPEPGDLHSSGWNTTASP